MAVNNLLAGSDRDPRIEFWSHPKRWPMDAPDHVFLARAFLEYGRKRHGAAWADDLPTTSWVRELPERLDLHTPTSEIWHGVHVLREISPTYNERCGSGQRAGMLLAPDFPTKPEWDEAVEKSRMDAKASWERLKRYYVVVFELQQAFLRGMVKCFLRPAGGGEPQPIEWHFWNSESTWARFETCRSNRDEPFKHEPSLDGDWIFVDRTSFQAFMALPVDSSTTSGIEQPTVERIRRNKTPGRKRGSQIDYLARQYFEWMSDGTIDRGISDNEVARRLAVWAAEVWETPVGQDYIRRSVAIWRSGPPEPEEF